MSKDSAGRRSIRFAEYAELSDGVNVQPQELFSPCFLVELSNFMVGLSVVDVLRLFTVLLPVTPRAAVGAD